MAENIPFGYAQRGTQGQRPPSGNMRYGAMGMGAPRSRTPPENRQHPPENEIKTAPRQNAERLPEQGKAPKSDPLAMLGINGLDREKLILIAVIVLLAKNGADWIIIAALIYIML